MSLLLQNGLPSPSKSYVFNGDFVDRGKQSLEILIILFTFLLIYPKEVHLNRGNHEDHMVNLRYGFLVGLMTMSRVSLQNLTQLLFSCSFRYGFTKEVMQKYKVGMCSCLLQHVRCGLWRPDASTFPFCLVLLVAWEENLEDDSECLLLVTSGHPDWSESPCYTWGRLWYYWSGHAWENSKEQSRFYFLDVAKEICVADLWLESLHLCVSLAVDKRKGKDGLHSQKVCLGMVLEGIDFI